MDRTTMDPRAMTAAISKALFEQSERFRRAVEFQLTGKAERPARVASMERIGALLARACNVGMARITGDAPTEARAEREMDALRQELRDDAALREAVRVNLPLLVAVGPKEGAPRVNRLTRDVLSSALRELAD